MAQLHKKFTDEQVKELLSRYLKREIERDYIQEIFGIKRRRFCELVKKYQEDPNSFSIQYTRKKATRKIPQMAEKNILKELSIEKKLIQDKDVPIRFYNYSYIKDHLENAYDQKAALSTIIDRAKKHGFYLGKHEKNA